MLQVAKLSVLFCNSSTHSLRKFSFVLFPLVKCCNVESDAFIDCYTLDIVLLLKMKNMHLALRLFVLRFLLLFLMCFSL